MLEKSRRICQIKRVKRFWVVATGLCLAAIAVADYLTGYEVELSPFYLIPIAIAAWHAGLRAGIVTGAGTGIIWATVDYLAIHPYAHEFSRYWNATTLGCAFVVFGVLVARLGAALDMNKRQLAETAEALQKLEESTAELVQLRGTFQTVCAWTKEIKDGDNWISLEEYISRHMQIHLTHGISPAGKELIRQSAKPVEKQPSEKNRS